MSSDAPSHPRSAAALADLVTPMAVRVAATLRLADRIADGITSTESLASAAGAEPRALLSLLRHLVRVGLLAEEGGAWTVTSTGAVLCEGHPSGLRAALDLEGPLGRADLAFFELLTSVRTGGPAFEARYGRGFWDDLAADPARAAAYDQAMSADAARWAESVVPAYPWGRFHDIADVGGGDGTLLAAILAAHPGLTGTLIDQPATVERARRRFASAGLGDRARALAGDFFAEIPAGAGAYILCAILHDWPDAEAVRILSSCAAAAAPSGRVIVIEKTGADGESPSTAMDLRMLAYFGGHERGTTEIAGLAALAGFRVEAVYHAGDLAVIELAPLG